MLAGAGVVALADMWAHNIRYADVFLLCWRGAWKRLMLLKPTLCGKNATLVGELVMPPPLCGSALHELSHTKMFRGGKRICVWAARSALNGLGREHRPRFRSRPCFG